MEEIKTMYTYIVETKFNEATVTRKKLESIVYMYMYIVYVIQAWLGWLDFWCS